MLFVIPGFPLITAGLDIAKLDMRSGIERLSYAVSIIVMATLVGWMVAECVGLAPDDFAPTGPFAACPYAPARGDELRWRIRLLGDVQQPGKDGRGSWVDRRRVQYPASDPCRCADDDSLHGPQHGNASRAAVFIGALVSGLLASLAEVKLTYPRIALTVPSIVIMVPGLYLYRSMYYMCTFDTVNMLGWFVRAVLIVAFLPVGLGVARTLTDPRWRHTS